VILLLATFIKQSTVIPRDFCLPVNNSTRLGIVKKEEGKGGGL